MPSKANEYKPGMRLSNQAKAVTAAPMATGGAPTTSLPLAVDGMTLTPPRKVLSSTPAVTLPMQAQMQSQAPTLQRAATAQMQRPAMQAQPQSALQRALPGAVAPKLPQSAIAYGQQGPVLATKAPVQAYTYNPGGMTAEESPWQAEPGDPGVSYDVRPDGQYISFDAGQTWTPESTFDPAQIAANAGKAAGQAMSSALAAENKKQSQASTNSQGYQPSTQSSQARQNAIDALVNEGQQAIERAQKSVYDAFGATPLSGMGWVDAKAEEVAANMSQDLEGKIAQMQLEWQNLDQQAAQWKASFDENVRQYEEGRGMRDAQLLNEQLQTLIAAGADMASQFGIDDATWMGILSNYQNTGDFNRLITEVKSARTATPEQMGYAKGPTDPLSGDTYYGKTDGSVMVVHSDGTREVLR